MNRLKYKDSTPENKVIATLNGSQGDIKRARWQTKAQAIDKLTVWAKISIQDIIPIKISQFNASEPEIFWQGDRFNKSVQSVNTTNDTFTVSGDVTSDFEEGGALDISGSTGNDGIYTVDSQSDVSYDSGNDETTITVVEDVTDSTADGTAEGWENIFRCYAENRGIETEDGALKITLYDFSKYTGRDSVSITSAVTTNIVDAMSNLIPNDYTLDTPSSSSVTYIDSSGTEQTGYPPIGNWTLSDKRSVGYRELTKFYGWALKFKADKTIRYEPLGYGGTVDDIYSKEDWTGSESLGKWKEWIKERTKDLITQVKVIGKDSNDQKVASDIKTNSLASDYGNKFRKIKVGYTLENKDEANRIAEAILSGEQNPTEGGKIIVPVRYKSNVSNDSFNLKKSIRNIDGSYTCITQVNFYPENKSQLRFEFEAESEKAAEGSENLRQERASQITQSTEGVGNQNFNGDTGSAPSDTNIQGQVSDNQSDTNVTGTVSDNQSDTNVTGDIDTAGGSTIIENTSEFEAEVTLSENSWQTIESFGLQTTHTQGAFVYVSAWVEPNISVGSLYANEFRMDVRVERDGNYFPNSSGIDHFLKPIVVHDRDGNDVWTNQTVSYLIFLPEDTYDNVYSVEVYPTEDIRMHYFVKSWTIGEHTHPDDFDTQDNNHPHSDDFDTQDNNHPHSDTFDTGDNSHGGTGDVTGQHGCSGSTDTKDINVSIENKDDRS